jgi:hypothetical protein
VADLARFAGTDMMPEYRLYTLGDDGHLTRLEPLICANDEEAIAKAKNLAQRRDVELWSGSRLVKSMPAKAVTHEIHEGCMVPKSAK